IFEVENYNKSLNLRKFEVIEYKKTTLNIQTKGSLPWLYACLKGMINFNYNKETNDQKNKF
ncbi:26345_t:CDS:2, partial [Gigaspora margarita]